MLPFELFLNEKRVLWHPKPTIQWAWFLFLLPLKEVPLVENLDFYKYMLGFVWCCSLKWTEDNPQSALTTTNNKPLSCSHIIYFPPSRNPNKPYPNFIFNRPGTKGWKHKPVCFRSPVTQWKSAEPHLGGVQWAGGEMVPAHLGVALSKSRVKLLS